MTSGKSNKTNSEQILILLNEAQKLVLHVGPSSFANNSIDITASNGTDEADRPDPLRVPEIIIVICVLLLWCGSILIFIRHSELLRIRHRDLPYRSSTKAPMNLNHITVVNRTSDMVIHSKPRLSSAAGITSVVYNHPTDEYKRTQTISSSIVYLARKGQHTHSIDSDISITKYPYHEEQLLDPHMISSNVRHSLLDLHRKSVDNLSAIRYNMLSYSTNDVSRHQQTYDQHLTVDERCIRESPV